MRPAVIKAFLSLCLLVSGILAKGQSLYEMTCRLPGPKGQTAHAFVVYEKDGGGFVRIAWNDSLRKEKVITELELSPKYQVTLPRRVTDKDSSGDYASLVCCTAAFVKNVQGKAPFPADSFSFWLKSDGTALKPYTGNLLRFDTTQWDRLHPGEDQYSFSERFYGNYDDFFPEPLGFLDSPNISGYRILTPAQLNYSFLKDYFTPAEMVYPFPVSVKQLNSIRAKGRVTLYCITLTDVSDDVIGQTTVKDRDHIDQFFRKAAEVIDIKYKRILLEKSSFSRAKVESTIRSLSVGSNDIVVFAYSGHGFSFTNDPAYQYPQMKLWTGPQTDAIIRAQSLNLETVFNSIRAKGARLNIVIGDCCNTDVGITRHVDPNPVSQLAPPVKDLLVRRNYMRLLVEAKGSYIACAARKGEMSAGNISMGGIFTFCLVNELESQIYPSHRVDVNQGWTEIFTKITERARNIASGFDCEPDVPCRQTLVYKKVSAPASASGRRAAPKRKI